MRENHIKDEVEYLNIIRAGITRPMVFLKRNTQQLYVNAFHPWLAKILQSNMDIQIILEEYSCASEMRNKYPDEDYEELLKKISINLLNTVEMCTQEAAWYLLRLEFSRTSTEVEYILTT